MRNNNSKICAVFALFYIFLSCNKVLEKDYDWFLVYFVEYLVCLLLMMFCIEEDIKEEFK